MRAAARKTPLGKLKKMFVVIVLAGSLVTSLDTLGSGIVKPGSNSALAFSSQKKGQVQEDAQRWQYALSLESEPQNHLQLQWQDSSAPNALVVGRSVSSAARRLADTDSTLMSNNSGAGERLTANVDKNAGEERNRPSIPINAENFPDPAFRNWLLRPENLNGIGADAQLTPEEIDSCTRMVMKRQGVKDLRGINFFTALRFLDVEGNLIETVDISGLSELEVTYLRTNKLRQVDLSHNLKLKFIEIFDNRLESIDVSMLSELEFLHVDHNKLTTLDMSHNLNLKGGGFIVRNQPNLQTVKLPNISGESIDAENFHEQDPRAGYSTWKWQYQGEPDRKIGPRDILPFDGSTLEVVRDPNPYRIVFNPGADGVKGQTPSIDATWDQDIILPEPGYVRSGYSFVGWKLPNTTVKAPGENIRNISGRNDYNKLATITALWKAETLPETGNETETKFENETDQQPEKGEGEESGKQTGESWEGSIDGAAGSGAGEGEGTGGELAPGSEEDKGDSEGSSEGDEEDSSSSQVGGEGVETDSEGGKQEENGHGEETNPETSAGESEAAANWRRERLAREIALAKAKAQLFSLKLSNATRENYLQQLADAPVKKYGQILAQAQKKAREIRKRNLPAAS